MYDWAAQYGFDKNNITPVNTFYPHGTVCYVDKSGGSCPEFGVSGSGIVREWRRRPEHGPAVDYNDYSDYGTGEDYEEDLQYQHSFVRPLSMSKGCDLIFDYSHHAHHDHGRVIYRDEENHDDEYHEDEEHEDEDHHDDDHHDEDHEDEARVPEFIYRGKYIDNILSSESTKLGQA